MSATVFSKGSGGPGHSMMLNVDYSGLVSQGDLFFSKQVSESYLGVPIGNGRNGGLVWTEPTKIKTQVNRVDFYGHGGASSATSIHGDYFGAVGNVTIDFGGIVFPSEHVPQYLSIYNATETIQGSNITANLLAWSDQDVIVVHVNDTRPVPEAINIDLTMTRSGPLETKNNYSATSIISQRNGKMILTQKFEEPCDTGITTNDFYNMSAVVIDVSGRTATANQLDAQTIRLSIPASMGGFTIYIGSSASMKRADDVIAIASASVETAKSTGFTRIYNSHTAWWHNYWSKSFITFPNVQGQGYDKDFGAHFINFYYIMASCFRGKYPAKFNGLLFNTANGHAMWGSQYWIFNDGRSYYGLETGNHPELLDPFLNMISSNLAKYEIAAQQQWGSQGIYIPETSSFDGPEVLPDKIAASLRNSLLNGLDISQAVKEFRNKRVGADGSGADSRWTIDGQGGQWKSGWHSHLIYDAASIASLFWDRYLYSMDINYLRNTAYPVIKGAAEFYRTFPNLKKGTDNKYHIYKTGFAETIWGADDILNDLNYIRGLLPTAVKAAQLLNVDLDLIPLWQDIVANLTPNPLSSDDHALLPRTSADGKPTYALARNPYLYLEQTHPTVWDEYQVELLDFDQVNLESQACGVNLNAWDLNMNTLETQEAFQNYSDGVAVGGWSRFMTDCARMGRSDKIKQGLTSHLMFWKDAIVSNPNRLPSTNGGAQTLSVQEDGVLIEGIQNALLQSLAKQPGDNPVIYAFGAWPKDIDAAFQLQAKKGFTVTSSVRSEIIEFIEIYSSLGQMCDVNNPWGALQSVDLYRNGAKAESLSGRLLSFNTAIGENVVIIKSGTTLSQYQRTISYPSPMFMNLGNTL